MGAVGCRTRSVALEIYGGDVCSAVDLLRLKSWWTIRDGVVPVYLCLVWVDEISLSYSQGILLIVWYHRKSVSATCMVNKHSVPRSYDSSLIAHTPITMMRFSITVEQVAKILSASKHKRVSDHFSKHQRRNIEMWLKMTQVRIVGLLNF